MTPNAPVPPPHSSGTPDSAAPLWHGETTQASLQESTLPVLVSTTVTNSLPPPEAQTTVATAEDQGAEQPQHETPGRAKPAPQPLPPALKPWHAWLQWFPHDSALAIGGLLPRLQAAMGQYRGTLQRGAHTPNGIDEIRSRGPYHRLLLSEWALADEAPDEFLRRASSGEHLFLSPRYETIKADAQIVAVFDTGPAQFGAARLAHIALWILLARRAEQAGIGFRWGVLGAPGTLDAGGDAQALKRLLAARSLQHPGTTQLEAWHDALATDPCQGGERWLIGGLREDIVGFSHRVGVARDLEAQLTVRIAGSAGTREVEVPLPPAKASTRLLRGAFAFEVATSESLPMAETIETSEKLSLRQPPLIGAEGRHIVVPILGENAAMIYPTSSLKHADRKQSAQKPKERGRKSRWSSANDLLCGALSGKQFGGIVADMHHLYFWQVSGFRTLSRPPKEQLQASPGQAYWLPCLWFNSGMRPHHFVLIDNAARLLAFAGNKSGGDEVSFEKLDDGALAIARANEDQFVYVRRGQRTIDLMLRNRRKSATVAHGFATPPLSPHPPNKAFIHCRSRSRQRMLFGAWCVRWQHSGGEDSASMWMVYPIAQGTEAVEGQPIHVQPGWQVVGLTPVPNTASEYGLVAIAANRKRLVLLRAVGSETLYASARSITAASVATDCDLIALITEDRQLVTLTPGGEQMRWNADDAEHDDD